MKIAYLAVDVDIALARGSATHTIEVARGLKKLGHEVCVFSRKGGAREPDRDKVKGITINSIYRGIFFPLRESHSPSTGKENSFLDGILQLIYFIYLRTIYLLYCSFFVLHHLKNDQPDLVLERGSCLGVGAIVSLLLDRPLVVEVIDPNHSVISLHRAGGVLAYTRRVLKMDIPPDRLMIVDAAVNNSMFSPPGSDYQGTREGLDIESDIFVAGYVGIFETWHGTETIIAAAQKLSEERMRFLMVGPGYEDTKEALPPGIGEKVIFTGGVDRECVPSMISAMDITLAPFLEKGPEMEKKGYYFSPLKIFEYAACGKPVIASDLEMIRRSLPHAILVKPGDPVELADALRKAKDNRAWARRRGLKDRRIVISHHSWTSFCRDLIDQFRIWRNRRKQD